MTIADKNLQDLCQEIMNSNNSTEGEKVRPKYADGTPSHTLFVNQVFEKYDLSKGQLPIVTLRQTAWKSGIKEILWIYQDQSNDLDLLRDKHGITWWDEWDIGDRTIGQRYGATVKDRKSTRLNSSHANISYAVFCLKKNYHLDCQCLVLFTICTTLSIDVFLTT